MRISDVLAALRIEFPAVTTSKLRFLEDQGLVRPVRTAAGYRQYSSADVERLRYVLGEQRDRYLPLKVIADQLAALDAGERDAPPPHARLAAREGEPATPVSATRRTPSEVAQDAGVDRAQVDELIAAGLLRPGEDGRVDPSAHEVVVLAGVLQGHGVDARHLRAFRAAAERQADLVDQIVAPRRAQSDPSARNRAAALAAELGEVCGQLHAALVRSAVADLAP